MIPNSVKTQFKPGNQLWKNRLNVGRNTIFATPEELWDAACKYFQFCDDNPWYKAEQGRAAKPAKKRKPKEGEQIDEADDQETGPENTVAYVPAGRPYTIDGLCVFTNCSPGYFRTFKVESAGREDRTDFLAVIDAIETVIRNQKFEGASIGVFNATIIARDLGLKEHSELTGAGGTPLVPVEYKLNLPPGLNISLPSNTDGEEEANA
jgi:hypothetical protein